MKYRFEDIITEYIKDKKISAETFGKMLKVKPEEVKKWLIGMNLPDWKKRNEILRTIQCPVDVEDRDGFKYENRMKKEFEKKSNRMDYYKSEEWSEKSEERFKIDNYTCQLCGLVDKTGKNLVAHHLKYSHDYGGNENMELETITLCTECHNRVHNNKPVCKHTVKEFEGGRKVLLLPKVDGTVKQFLFTDTCNDKDIIKYIEKIEKKNGVNYKYKTIAKINEKDGVITSEKLKLLLK